MGITPRPQHIFEADKFADQIFSKATKEQQEMLEAIRVRLLRLNRDHLKRLEEL